MLDSIASTPRSLYPAPHANKSHLCRKPYAGLGAAGL